MYGFRFQVVRAVFVGDGDTEYVGGDKKFTIWNVVELESGAIRLPKLAFGDPLIVSRTSRTVNS